MSAVTPDVRVSRWQNRFFAQHVLIPHLVKQVRPEAIFALVPGVPIFPLALPVVSVVYDLRSWIRPDEFPRWVRIYRRIAHHHAFHRSDRLITISERSRRDLAHACRRAASKTTVIYPAADHVDDWPSSPRESKVITFGHWSNKRPDLAIQAWARVLRVTRSTTPWILHVVGVPNSGRDSLGRAALDLGVTDSVVIHGYLPKDEYQQLFTSASAVLMLSSFEGFGLPVVEAMRRGIHVIASRDPALLEAGGSSAVYVDDEAGLSNALAAVLSHDAQVQLMVQSGLVHTRDMAWASAAARSRAVIQNAIAARKVMPELAR